jgi:hypothetical protein
MPQGQLYPDNSNLFFVLAKRKTLHQTKHKIIQNIMAAKFCIKENNI